MEAAAHNPKFAKKAGIKSDVAQEFVAADDAGPTKPARPPRKAKGK